MSFGNICGKRSFSNPRRTVENKIRNISAFNNFTQRSVGCNKMLLSHNVINCLWTNPVRKRFVHNITPCRWFCCKNNYISYSTFVRTFCQVKVTARRGVHRTPALINDFVYIICFDVMKIVYPNVAAFSERQSFWLQNQNEHIHSFCYAI